MHARKTQYQLERALNIRMFNEEISELIEANDIAEVVIDVCATLYQNGITYVHVGGLMRILGVSTEECAEHDEVYFQLDDEFAERVREMYAIDDAYEAEISVEDSDSDVPPTIH